MHCSKDICTCRLVCGVTVCTAIERLFTQVVNVHRSGFNIVGYSTNDASKGHFGNVLKFVLLLLSYPRGDGYHQECAIESDYFKYHMEIHSLFDRQGTNSLQQLPGSST